MIREGRREGEGAAHGECGCSSLRVRWWWMLTINSRRVEISIVGGIRDMFRDPKPMSFFFLFFIMCFVLNNYWEQRLRAALAMVKEKAPSPLIHPVPGKKPSTQVSLVRDQPHSSRAK